MDVAVRHFAIACLLVVGLSHVIRPRVWARFFAWLGGAGGPGAFAAGMLSLTWGAIIVSFHNVWEGPATLLTLAGWGALIKGSVYLTFPALGVRAMTAASRSGTKFRIAGLALMMVAGVLMLA